MWPVRGSSPGSGIAGLTFPTSRSVAFESGNGFPLQWRGRTGITPVSVAPARHMNCGRNLSRRFPIFNYLLGHDELVNERGATGTIVFAAGSGAWGGCGIDVIQGGDLARQRILCGSRFRKRNRWSVRPAASSDNA